ncbi:MAG: hypothetical protein V3S24_17445 [Candidatus Tectomicrobia bacterium]
MTRDELSAVLATHYQAHQALEPRDIYKLLYQRVFGPEHSVENLSAARERLYLEVLQLPETPSAIPLFDPLSPILCRVNLQPFVQDGGDIGQLWKVFRQTVGDFQPGILVDLQRDWSRFRAASWAQRYAPELLDQFWQSMATADFSPVHHSRGYAEANTPHYRVVLRSLAEVRLGVTL